MFELSMPWWEFVLRAVVVYVVLLAMIRLSGKRTMGQFTPFDMLLIVLLGNAVQNALLGEDTSMAGGLLLAATLIALNWLVGFVTSRSQRAERLLEGVPVVLARDGQVFRDVLQARTGQPRRFRQGHARSRLQRHRRGAPGAAGNQRPHQRHRRSRHATEAAERRS